MREHGQSLAGDRSTREIQGDKRGEVKEGSSQVLHGGVQESITRKGESGEDALRPKGMKKGRAVLCLEAKIGKVQSGGALVVLEQLQYLFMAH